VSALNIWVGRWEKEKRSVLYVVMVKIEIKVDDELLKALTRLADSLEDNKKSEVINAPQEKIKSTISLTSETQKLSIVELRELMAVKKKEGKSSFIKGLLDKYGVLNLTALEENVYPEFYKDLEVL
jgi:hypothetical protein